MATLLDAIRPVAETHRITSSQLALAWALHQPGCTHVLAGARTAEQITETAAAGGVVLTKDELAKIDAALDRLFPAK